MTLRLPRALYDEFRAHGEETYPEESCGALLGRESGEGWQIAAVVRAGNVAVPSARSRYEIAPAELVRIAREARSRGLEIAGFYHSHPDAEAHWSATDLIQAHWISGSYAITAVVRGKATETRSFRLTGATEEDKHFEPETIEVSEA